MGLKLRKTAVKTAVKIAGTLGRKREKMVEIAASQKAAKPAILRQIKQSVVIYRYGGFPPYKQEVAGSSPALPTIKSITYTDFNRSVQELGTEFVHRV